MSEQKTVSVIRERFDSQVALQRVAALAGTADSSVEQELLYPYFHHRARCAVPTLIGRKWLTVDCLVDSINGSGATADPFDCESRVVPPDRVLSPGIGRDDAERVAQRTLTHRLGRKFRMIAPFEVELACSGVVYRGFWIVRVGAGRVMVDSVTGAIQSLSASAA